MPSSSDNSPTQPTADLLPLLRQRKARGHYASIYGDAIDWAADEIERLRTLLKEARRAIGNHHAPDDCYATGPMTGDPYRDLVECPACSFIAMYEQALAKAEAVSGS